MIKKTILKTTLFSLILSFTASLFANSDSTIRNTISDVAITTKIKALYAKSPALKSEKISVTTSNQVVALEGQLKTNHQYERAVIIAQSVNEVKTVNADNLTVKSSDAPLTDTFITAKVKSKFIKEKIFGTRNIQLWPVKVETKDSVVYLSGTVGTPKQRKNLIALANNVDGVKSVKSSLTVK